MNKMTHDQRVLAHQQGIESASQVAAPAPPDQHGDAQSNQRLTMQKGAQDQRPAPPQVANLICADNSAHRALFSLPPINVGDGTGLAVPELPVQRIVTGDREVDAMIWLRQVIGTGQPALIEKAKKAAKKIKTPFEELEKRYATYLGRTSRNLFASMASIGFADLESWEKTSIEVAARRHEAAARFGDSLFENTAAETFAEHALAGAKQGRDEYDLDKADVDARFDACSDQRPVTLSDCLVELKFWDALYWLRNAVDRDRSEGSRESFARKDYTFRCLGRIPPRSTEEAHQVLQYMIDDNAMDWEESFDILRNLMTQTGTAAPAPIVVLETPEIGANLKVSPAVEGDGGGAEIEARAARAESILLKIDGYMAASGYGVDHPWRRDIASVAPQSSASGAWGLASAPETGAAPLVPVTHGEYRLTAKKMDKLVEMQRRVCDMLEANGVPAQVEAAGDLRSATGDLWDAVDEQITINELAPTLADWMATPAGLLRVLAGALRAEQIEGNDEYNDGVQDCIDVVTALISDGAVADQGRQT